MRLNLLPGAYAEHLSCVDANVELLLRARGVEDVLTLLGAPYGMRVTPFEPVDVHPAASRAAAWSWAQVELVASHADDSPQLLQVVRAVIAGRRVPVLVTADAFTVTWNPYCGHEHHEHAFVIDGYDDDTKQLHIVDAYTNSTPYGVAAPLAEWVSNERLGASLEPCGPSFRIEHIEGEPTPGFVPVGAAAALITRNVEAHEQSTRDGTGVEALVEVAAGNESAEVLHWLALATWLTTRSRAIHARWWQQLHAHTNDAGAAELARIGTDDVAPRWQSAQTSVFLAWRRVDAGRACPPNFRQAVAAAAEADLNWCDAMAKWRDD